MFTCVVAIGKKQLLGGGEGRGKGHCPQMIITTSSGALELSHLPNVLLAGLCWQPARQSAGNHNIDSVEIDPYMVLDIRVMLSVC